jgi:hypothetical protein
MTPASEPALDLVRLQPDAPLAHQAPAASAPAPERIDPALAAEVALLATARQLASREPARALTLLTQHAREFPGGALSLEREVLVIECLHRSGRRGQAAERARQLLSRAPKGLYATRLRRLLEERP